MTNPSAVPIQREGAAADMPAGPNHGAQLSCDGTATYDSRDSSGAKRIRNVKTELGCGTQLGSPAAGGGCVLPRDVVGSPPRRNSSEVRCRRSLAGHPSEKPER